ncbi:MAG: PorT family protein [Tannerellaceae bacterium]|nr:PorT family protein [Tannerellaceae bacterium]
MRNQPYADLKLYHFGFHIGVQAQDLLLYHNGEEIDGEQWFAEIPSYSPGFSVGVMVDFFLNLYVNFRITPTLHFGDRNFLFREQRTGELFSTTSRSNYVTLPLDFKFSSMRINNYRPYLLSGIYGAIDIGRKKGNPILLRQVDYGLTFGLGCDFYLPFFKFCPEFRLCFGIPDLLETDRHDLIDHDLAKYTRSLRKATSRMVVFTFYFE